MAYTRVAGYRPAAHLGSGSGTLGAKGQTHREVGTQSHGSLRDSRVAEAIPARRIFLLRSIGPSWAGLQRELESLPDVTVVGSAASAAEARRHIAALQPEMIISGLTVAGESTIALLADLRAELPAAIIVVIVDHFSEDEAKALAELGVAGCWGWDDLADPSFVGAHDAVRSSTFAVWSRSAFQTLTAALLRPRQPAVAPLPLGERKRSVLALIVEGVGDDGIAAQLNLSHTTVRTHLRHLIEKTGTVNRTHLAYVAGVQGLLDQ